MSRPVPYGTFDPEPRVGRPNGAGWAPPPTQTTSSPAEGHVQIGSDMAKGPRKGSGVEPCTNKDCRFPTRPSRKKPHEMPGTRARCGGGVCGKCYQAALRREQRLAMPAAVESDRNEKFIPLGAPDPNIVSGLEAFIARRQAREMNTARKLYPGMAQPRRTA